MDKQFYQLLCIHRLLRCHNNPHRAGNGRFAFEVYEALEKIINKPDSFDEKIIKSFQLVPTFEEC